MGRIEDHFVIPGIGIRGRRPGERLYGTADVIRAEQILVHIEIFTERRELGMRPYDTPQSLDEGNNEAEA